MLRTATAAAIVALTACAAHAQPARSAASPPVGSAAPASATSPAAALTPAQTIAAQRAAMAKLNHLHGVWQGPSTAYLPGGEVRRGNVTHRVGPMLDNGIKVMEGRNLNDAGQTQFNGMIILWYDAAAKQHKSRSFTVNGGSNEVLVTMTDRGYYFDVPEPALGAFRRVNIFVSPNEWGELVERHLPDGRREKTFEMTLRRVRDTSWPASLAGDPPVARTASR